MSLQAQDLGGGYINTFTVQADKRLPIGASIEIDFDDNFQFFMDIDLDKDKAINSFIARTGFLSSLGLNAFPEESVNRNLRIRSRDRSDGKTSAVISGYDSESDVYSLQILRNLVINGQEEESFLMTAQVNSMDISTDRATRSSKLANIVISYENQENSVVLSEEDFSSFSFEPLPEDGAEPESLALGAFPQTFEEFVASIEAAAREPEEKTLPKTELNSSKKRELFLYYLNRLFQDWF